jgi:hypothetical protein
VGPADQENPGALLQNAQHTHAALGYISSCVANQGRNEVPGRTTAGLGLPRHAQQRCKSPPAMTAGAAPQVLAISRRYTLSVVLKCKLREATEPVPQGAAPADILQRPHCSSEFLPTSGMPSTIERQQGPLSAGSELCAHACSMLAEHFSDRAGA